MPPSTTPLQGQLRGKTALVTGSSRGIGRGIALALAAQGCHVAVHFARRRQEAEETVQAVMARGVQSAAFRANLAREDAARQLVAEVVEHFGGVDIFVANAASGTLRPALELEAKAWDWTFNINVRSVLAAVQSAVPAMRQRGWGRIITVTSAGSRRVIPHYGVVGISKAALEALTRYLAVELAPDGITVNGVSPGFVETDALDFFPNRDEMLERAVRATPAGRLVTPEDVGQVVAWLCSDQAAMIVGQIIEIDGGYGLLAQG